MMSEVQGEVSTICEGSATSAAISSAGVGGGWLVVLSSPKSMQPILEPFSFPCADKLYGDANFFF